MQIDKKSYKKYADARAKKSPCAKNCACAFLYGGVICTIAQGLKDLYMTFLKEEEAGSLVSVTLIFVAALLTGIGVFDRIAKTCRRRNASTHHRFFQCSCLLSFGCQG